MPDRALPVPAPRPSSAVPLTIFLDRDGTINRKRPEGEYVTRWEEFEFLPGALAGIRSLSRTGARLLCITNQRGIARKRMTGAALDDIHRRMILSIRAAGGRIDGIYVCPHEAGRCRCRKPETGLFERALADFPDLRFAASVLAGDSISDMEAAARIGSRAALITAQPDDGPLREALRHRGIRVDVCVASLEALAEWLASRPVKDWEPPL